MTDRTWRPSCCCRGAKPQRLSPGLRRCRETTPAQGGAKRKEGTRRENGFSLKIAIAATKAPMAKHPSISTKISMYSFTVVSFKRLEPSKTHRLRCASAIHSLASQPSLFSRRFLGVTMVSIAIATAEAKNTSIKASMYSFTVVSFKESDDAESCIRRAKFNAVTKARLNARFVKVRHGSELDPTKGNGEKSPLQAGVDNPGRRL